MAAQLSKQEIVSRETLGELVELRLREAEALYRTGHYVGSIYLAGYAVECQLKLTICRVLDWDHLRATFRTHDLALLVLHSGLSGVLEQDSVVHESLSKIQGVWNPAVGESIRYVGTGSVTRESAGLFLAWVNDPNIGVVPWLRRMIS